MSTTMAAATAGPLDLDRLLARASLRGAATAEIMSTSASKRRPKRAKNAQGLRLPMPTEPQKALAFPPFDHLP
jgi:hypothetical protein